MIKGYGYEGMNIDAFMEKLKDDKIQIIFDVRMVPVSRKPGFNKKSFAKRCKDEGIIYRHFAVLGISSKDRVGIEHAAVRAKVLNDYNAKLSSNRDAEIRNALYEIRNAELQGISIAVMCFEKNECECHRQFVISEVCSFVAREKKRLSDYEEETRNWKKIFNDT